MKVIIQIPCFNESQTLPLVFQNMPHKLEGVSQIEFLVIDDGSTDNTTKVAAELGVHHVLHVPGKNRRWLGRAFKLGIDHALALGADIVVNTDGDNQYSSTDIATLLAPILAGKAEISIGDRNPGSFQEFSLGKRILQRIGSRTVEFFTEEHVPDAVSGFRAYSRNALLQIHVLTNFTYTVDTLIQAHKKGIDVAWVKITPNSATRESRLIHNNLEKVCFSGGNILRLVCIYEPFRVFFSLGLLALLPGLALLARFFYFYFFWHEEAAGHIQSVVIGGALTVIGIQLFLLSILGGLLGVNRRLLEDLLTRIRKLEIPDQSEVREPLRIAANDMPVRK